MKYIIILILSFLFLQQNKAQTNDQWIYNVNYQVTSERNANKSRLTKVFMDINPAAFDDSAKLLITIGSTLGQSDILSKHLIYTTSIINGKDILSVDGKIRIYLGKYVIKHDTQFYVDLKIKSRGRKHKMIRN
jgi:hypothetical protein